MNSSRSSNAAVSPVERGASTFGSSLSTWTRCVFLLLVTTVAYFETWVNLWPYWNAKNATYTHGSLIALVAVWLVWRTRTELAHIRPMASFAGWLLSVVLAFVWLLAMRANVFILHAVVWPMLALSILWAGVGWPAASRFLFPLGFLYFAIPVWELLKPPLQHISATMVGLVTDLLGVPAIVHDAYVTMPTGTIYIALDCSGTHFLAVALAVGALAGVIRGDDFRKRLMILAVAGALSMAFNWLRIIMIILAYLNEDLQRALESIGHVTLGWWVFALDLLVFALVLRSVPVSDAQLRTPQSPQLQPSSRLLGFVLVIATVLALPLSSIVLQRSSIYPPAAPRPLELAGASQALPDPDWQPKFIGAAWEYRVAYLGVDGHVIELYRNEYHQQKQGAELISAGMPLFDPDEFLQVESDIVSLHPEQTSSFDANRLILRGKSGQLWIGMYTFLIDNKAIASQWEAQFQTGLLALYRRPTAGVLAVASRCDEDCDEIADLISDALTKVYEAEALNWLPRD